MGSLPEVFNSLMDKFAIDHLDFSPEEESDVCEVSIKSCSRKATWVGTMHSACPHDGFSVRFCGPCKVDEEDYLTRPLNGSDRPYCVRCSDRDIEIYVVWKEL